MHESRGSSISVPSSLIVFMLFLFSSSLISKTRGDMAMQLSRAELVRMAGYGEEKLSSVLVMGTLLCDACRQPGSDQLHVISHVAGAKVAVACRTKNKRIIYWAHGTTDEYGEFMVDLPSHLHAIPRLEEACVVMVLRLPKNSLCHHISRTNPSGIKLSSVGNSIRVYTAGTIMLNHRSNSFHSCSGKRDDGGESSW